MEVRIREYMCTVVRRLLGTFVRMQYNGYVGIESTNMLSSMTCIFFYLCIILHVHNIMHTFTRT